MTLALCLALPFAAGAALPPAAAGYPPPEVPECPRVADGYFTGCVLVGDSLSAGFDTLEPIPELDVYFVVGISPQSATKVRYFSLDGEKALLWEKMQALAPRCLYLMLGSNGTDWNLPANVLADYGTLLDQLLAVLPDTIVYCMAVTPVTPAARERFPYFTTSRIRTFNEGLKELARSRGVYYLPVFDVLADANGSLDRLYAAEDGIHLKAAAFRALADFLYTHAIPYPR